MIEATITILLILWVLGTVSGYVLGGFIHILLIMAVVLFISNLVTTPFAQKNLSSPVACLNRAITRQ